jgi:hypothetical protein
MTPEEFLARYREMKGEGADFKDRFNAVYPPMRQKEVEDRRGDMTPSKGMRGTLDQTPQNKAILQVLSMRQDPSYEFDEEGYVHQPPSDLPMARDLGVQDIKPQFTMDPTRDRYLAMIKMADLLKVPGTIPDMRVMPNKTDTAMDMVNAVLEGRGQQNEPIPNADGKSINQQIDDGTEEEDNE